uniref:Uncharacterized protein n=1 Tax=Arundo donax TaxID=35708 RepID=A0A0A9BXR9_ARUDO
MLDKLIYLDLVVLMHAWSLI